MASDPVMAAFSSDAWRDTANAVRITFGVGVSVLDESGSLTVDMGEKPQVCRVLEPGVPGPNGACPSVLHGHDGLMSGACQAGLSYLLVPVRVAPAADPEAFVLLEGFVAKRNDRSELVGRLLAKGLPEAEAEALAKDVPILGRAKTQVLRDLVSAAATALLQAEHRRAESERDRRTAVLIGELCMDVEAQSRDIVGVRALILERAMGLVGAEIGSLLMHKQPSDLLEIVTVCGGDPAHVGERVRIGDGIAGRCAANLRSAIITSHGPEGHAMPGFSIEPGSWISVPMSYEGRLIAVANLGRLPGRPAMTAEDLRSAEEYLASATAALTTSMSFARLREEVIELEHVNEVALALESGVDLDSDLALLASVMEKSFGFDVAGLVFNGYGNQRLFLALRGDLSQSDLLKLLSEATGQEHSSVPGIVCVHSPSGAAYGVDGAAEDWSVLSADLRFQDRTAGCLFVASTSAGTFTARDERVLNWLASHASPTIERASLLARLRDDLAKMLSALSATIEAKERRDHGRDRTMDYAVAIGERMGVRRTEIEKLRFAGLLHDIGKVGVAEEILLKPSHLTAEELESVRRHAEIGASIVEQLTFLHEVGPIILHHHERWDGKGYPMGLAGTRIPLLARILCVADSFQAMTTARAYRPSLGFRKAREELLAGSGTQFDPDVVSAFIEIIDEKALEGSTGLFAEFDGDEKRLPA